MCLLQQDHNPAGIYCYWFYRTIELPCVKGDRLRRIFYRIQVNNHFGHKWRAFLPLFCERESECGDHYLQNVDAGIFVRYPLVTLTMNSIWKNRLKIISFSASTGSEISSPSSFDYVVLCAALLVAYDSSGQQKYHSVRLQQLVL